MVIDLPGPIQIVILHANQTGKVHNHVRKRPPTWKSPYLSLRSERREDSPDLVVVVVDPRFVTPQHWTIPGNTATRKKNHIKSKEVIYIGRLIVDKTSIISIYCVKVMSYREQWASDWADMFMTHFFVSSMCIKYCSLIRLSSSSHHTVVSDATVT